MELDHKSMATEEWFDRILTIARDEEESLMQSRRRLDDTCGWGRLLSSMFANKAVLELPWGILLTGEEGCGRHSSAKIAAKAIVGDEDNELCYFHLSGSLLTEGTQSEADVLERIDRLMDYFSSDESERGPCFLIDDMERCFCRLGAETLLMQRIGQFIQDNIPVFIFYITDDETASASCLRRQLKHCVLRRPDTVLREEFFENQADDIETLLSENDVSYELSFDQLVRLTEGFSYKQLNDLLYDIKLWLLKYSKMDMNELEYLVDAQKTMETDKDIRRRWMESMIHFMEKTPTFAGNVQSISEANRQNEKTQTHFMNESIESEASVREKYERMPVNDLLDDLFGEGEFDRMNVIV